MMIRLLALLLALALLPLFATRAGARDAGGQPVALVTAERENVLLAVDLTGGRVLRRVTLPADPENVIAEPGVTTVVVSSKAGAVTLLDWRTLRIVKVFRGFRTPHLAAYAPDSEWAYVTDDSSGELVVIRLARPRIVARLFVGLGAHHLSVTPSGNRLWVALGERARTIAIVDTDHPGRPRLLRRFQPGYTVHDVAFSPDGREVWLTSDDETGVHVVSAANGRLLFTLPVGPPPQHVAFAEDVAALAHRAWLTSGYDSRIVLVDTRSGKIVRVHTAPYGSFNLAASGDLVVTSSLLGGTLSEFSFRLRPLLSVKLADAARDVAVTVW